MNKLLQIFRKKKNRTRGDIIAYIIAICLAVYFILNSFFNFGSATVETATSDKTTSTTEENNENSVGIKISYVDIGLFAVVVVSLGVIKIIKFRKENHE